MPVALPRLTIFALGVGVTLLASRMGPAATPVDAAPWIPSGFPISFWCGPPDGFTTIERYREIKAAGFTHVMPPCGGASTAQRNRHILGLCAATGLKAFIADARMPLRTTGEPEAASRLDAIVRDYAGYGALEGYFITDEPSAGAFAGLAEVVAYLHRIDPRHQAYINLLPNYANAQQLGTPSYEQYVRDFATRVHPFALSYDHYHMLSSGDRPGFFDNLEVMRGVSLEYQVPFWQIVLCVQHGPYRNLSEAELRYEAMQTLLYGGQGLMWFTYWQPDDPSFQWRHAMIDLAGRPDPHYAMVQRVNAEVAAFGSQLLGASSRLVYQVGNLPPGGTGLPAAAPIQASSAADLSIGVFDDRRGHTVALVTSADYRREVADRLRIHTGGKKLWRFDPATRRWQRLHQVVTTATGTVDVPLTLRPAAAELLRW